MKLVRTENAVGCVLCHDITQIIKGVTKDAVFRKGHIVRQEDIPVLLSVGKEHLYVWESDENTLHENDAAEILRDICMGENMHPTEPKEGKNRADSGYRRAVHSGSPKAQGGEFLRPNDDSHTLLRLSGKGGR